MEGYLFYGIHTLRGVPLSLYCEDHTQRDILEVKVVTWISCKESLRWNTASL